MILDKLQRKLHLKVCLFDGINSFPVLTELHKNRSIFHNTPYNEFTKFGTFHNFLPYTVSDSRVKWAILARISTISTRQIWHKIFSLKKFAYEIMNFLPYSFTFSGFAHRQTKLKDPNTSGGFCERVLWDDFYGLKVCQFCQNEFTLKSSDEGIV